MRQAHHTNASAAPAPLLRAEFGDVLRDLCRHQEHTSREISSDAQVSLGYLSEVKRGQKEASFEFLEAICLTLGVPLWFVLREVSECMAASSGIAVPDTVPEDLVSVTLIS